MVVVRSIHVRKRDDGKIESEAVVNAASGDTLSSGALGLNTIEAVTCIIPLVRDHVVTGVSITNPGSYNNSFTFTAYTISGGSLTSEAGSIDWFIKVIGE